MYWCNYLIRCHKINDEIINSENPDQNRSTLLAQTILSGRMFRFLTVNKMSMNLCRSWLIGLFITKPIFWRKTKKYLKMSFGDICTQDAKC